MRVLALHLPQFHEVSENNEWWGRGFTEWTNVRSAQPIFPGHRQPVHPLGHTYYDLTDPDSLRWQALLSRQYGVSGFVFFHYWYSGKKLLERPVELWRDTPDIEQEYALCWANHPWTRAWDGKDHEVLQAQTYGGKEDWDAHIDDLLTHFRDSRYIKVDGRPLLFIYNAGEIPDVDEMVEHWNARLAEEGVREIYLVEYISTKNPRPASKHSAAVYEDEPLYSLRFNAPVSSKAKRFLIKKLNLPDYQDYDKIWRLLLKKRRRYEGRAIIQGAFVAWDNSPRRGKRGPMIVRNASPAKFGKYLRTLLTSNRRDVSEDFVVINAWNEWGEGAMLEPSEEDGHAYLDAVSDARYWAKQG